MKIEMIIDENSKGLRIDKLLTLELDKSRTKIKELINNNTLMINDKIITKVSHVLELGDKVVFEYQDNLESISNITPQKMELDIRYEDEHLLIVNKKSGVVVHPGSGNRDKTLVNGLVNYLGIENLSSGNDELNIRPGIVHRLDKDTEGLLIIAKNDYIHNKLANLIKEKKVKRYYKALTSKKMEILSGTIEAPIQRNPKNKNSFMVGNDHAHKEAITKFRVIKSMKDYSLVEIELLTGRTHQIRVHFNYIENPILNDKLYGGRIVSGKNYENYAQFLQAYKIEFSHPILGTKIKIELDLPQEFNLFTKKFSNI